MEMCLLEKQQQRQLVVADERESSSSYTCSSSSSFSQSSRQRNKKRKLTGESRVVLPPDFLAPLRPAVKPLEYPPSPCSSSCGSSSPVAKKARNIILDQQEASSCSSHCYGFDDDRRLGFAAAAARDKIGILEAELKVKDMRIDLLENSNKSLLEKLLLQTRQAEHEKGALFLRIKTH